MGFTGRSLVTMDDLSTGEMEAIFSLTDEMSSSMPEQLGVCRGKIMASLFLEPSTRTRLSFEAAMLRHRLESLNSSFNINKGAAIIGK